MRSASLLVVAAVAVVGLLGGCGSTAASGPSATTALAAAPAGGTEVQAVDNRFEPTSLTVRVGSTVTWTNAGRNNHNVVPVTGGGFGVATKDFAPGATSAARFDTPGTYAYYCTIHGTAARGMTGTIVVVGP